MTNLSTQFQEELSRAKEIIAQQDHTITKQDHTITKQDHTITKQDQIIATREQRITILEEHVRLLLANRYARSSEKYIDPNIKQANLFDEAELAELNPDAMVADDKKTIEVPAHKRAVNRGKRVTLPEYLPRIRVCHELSAEELIGPDGEIFEKIGEIITEQLDIIPAKVQVIENVCFKYAVKGKEELGIKTAKMPKQPIPKSIATSGLLAHVATAKYCYHLPLYRQEQIWQSLDVRLPRNTLSRWMISMGEQVQELVDYLMEEIKLAGYVHADETPVVVLEKKPPDKSKKKLQKLIQPDKNQHKGYMWLYTNSKGAVFDYQTTRGGEHPARMLKEFNGYLQTDAYSGYDQFLSSKTIQLVGCFAHARRYFMDVRKAAGKKKKTPTVDYVCKLIGKLYKLEDRAKDEKMDISAIYMLRQEEALPILKKLHDYLIDIKPRVPPKSLLGKALHYTLNHWTELHRYTDSGILNIDNNPAERKIKPFVIGRKNWLFCGNIRGAKAAANLYSLIESAKLFDLKIFDYLKYVFEHLPLADTPRKLEQLLPQYAQAHVAKMKKPGS